MLDKNQRCMKDGEMKNIKGFFIMTIVLLMTVNVKANSDYTLVRDGVIQENVTPLLINGSIYVNSAEILDATGGFSGIIAGKTLSNMTIQYMNKVTNKSIIIGMVTNNKKYSYKNEEVDNTWNTKGTNTPPVIKNGLLYLPLRMIVEEFRGKIKFDSERKVIYVTTMENLNVKMPLDTDNIKNLGYCFEVSSRAPIPVYTQHNDGYGFSWYRFGNSAYSTCQVVGENEGVLRFALVDYNGQVIDEEEFEVTKDSIKNSAYFIKKLNFGDTAEKGFIQKQEENAIFYDLFYTVEIYLNNKLETKQKFYLMNDRE